MIASTARGILVTRFWYIREVDPYEKIFTGMTRDGTFLVGGRPGGRRSAQFPVQSGLIEMLIERGSALGRRFARRAKRRTTWSCRAMKVAGSTSRK